MKVRKWLGAERREDLTGGLLHIAAEMGAVVALVGAGSLLAWLLLLVL